MPDALTKLAEGERLLAAASTGPWQAVRDSHGENWGIANMGNDCDGHRWDVATRGVPCSRMRGDADSDAKFIAWARNNADALLAGMRALVEMCAHENTERRPDYERAFVDDDALGKAQEAVARFTEEQP